jgi:TonB-linked SusC/RagA family outer membrane protein
VLSVTAQQRTIRGVVKSADEPLVGVNVVEKGANNGTITDADGNFTIRVNPDATLEVSYLGYETALIKTQQQSFLNIELVEATQMLDEVIAIGYGTVRKSDLTGSISTMKLDDVAETSAISVGEAMMGKMAGVNIMSNTGEPGSALSFRIRGMTSVSGDNQPLYVIDGQPFDGNTSITSAGMGQDQVTARMSSDPLATINPNDIESIEVLKDASATAIYGSRGANGVILVTTRSGKEGRMKIQYNHRSDFSVVPKKLKVLNTQEYYEYLWEADKNMLEANAGYTPTYTSREAAMLAAEGLPDVNWQDELFGTGYSQDHQLQLSGGGKNDNYLISGNYLDNNGVVKNSYMKRGSIRINYSRNLTDKLRINFRSNYTFTQKNQIPQATVQGNLSGSAILAALAFKPSNRVYDEESGTLEDGVANNPVVLRENVPDKTNIANTMINVDLKYQLFPFLAYSIRGSYKNFNAVRKQYWARGTWQGNANNGRALYANNQSQDYLIENLLTFDKVMNKHRINAVAGYTWQKWYNDHFSQQNSGFLDDNLIYYHLEGAENPGVAYSTYNERALASVLGRVNYSYDDRYSIVATGRFDGSSRLAPGYKWSFFPSIGFAWNVINEAFMSGASRVLSNLKLRLSYGVSGNESIGIGATQAKLTTAQVVLGETIGRSYIQSSFDNPRLRWESTAQQSVGIDLGLWRQRVELNIDLYRKLTTDLLLNKSLPLSSGYGSYAVNAGEVENRGIDIEAKVRIIQKKKFSWSVGGNFSYLRNRVNSLGETDDIFGIGLFSSGSYNLGQAATIATVGHEIGAFYGYKTAGVYQNWAEVLAGPESSSARPGKVVFVDNNGDGIISEADKVIIGSPFPDFTYGFNTELSYKAFTLSMFFTGSYGNDVFNANRWPMGTLNKNTGTNVFKDAWENRWQGPGTGNGIIPAPSNEASLLEARLPDWMIEDASYFRLQQVNLSYTFRRPVSFIQNLKVFVAGSNLFTITKYTGYDPAVSAFGDRPLSSGIDLGTIPAARTYSVGFNVNF